MGRITQITRILNRFDFGFCFFDKVAFSIIVVVISGIYWILFSAIGIFLSESRMGRITQIARILNGFDFTFFFYVTVGFLYYQYSESVPSINPLNPWFRIIFFLSRRKIKVLKSSSRKEVPAL